MKTKEIQTLKAMKAEELTKVLKDAQSALEIYIIGRDSKQSKNSRDGRALKRKIAVIKTFMRQKELTNE